MHNELTVTACRSGAAECSLLALIAIFIVLCFFKYKRTQKKKAQAYGGAIGNRDSGREDNTAEALHLEEMIRK